MSGKLIVFFMAALWLVVSLLCDQGDSLSWGQNNVLARSPKDEYPDTLQSTTRLSAKVASMHWRA
ncbi:hypothetical protein A8V23_15240 [Yersinia pestis]|uniref:Exported protein n=1 Tax=Yersinia pestis TaxID=632 RepID=Q0WBD4_YERPE|nr:putative exported protein [Yersinia pestis CA88-4125]KPD87812.1 hypothetical protein ADT41_15810 [Yersinia pestis subsp. microtus bv. Caucasica]KYK06055.1 hypothetical protein AUL40_14380 [Yersinia pestis]CAL22103.1 putative exported protein [Yersinia pestis CO92]PVF33327.1 hypothetical protein A9312_14980 [Yersinia pestis]